MLRSTLLAAAAAVLLIATPASAVTLDPTALLSVSSGTSGGNDTPLGLDSADDGEAITPDGRYVAFVDASGNLTATTDANGNYDVFWRDTKTGETRLVSVNGAGTAAATFGATRPDISDDGRYVVFVSDSSDLLPGTTIPGGLPNVYLRDVATGTTTLVSRSAASATVAGNDRSLDPSISGNGQRIVFSSRSTTLETPTTQVPDGGTLTTWRIYARDVGGATTQLVTVAAGGAVSNATYSASPRITPDGRYVAFQSDGTDLMAGFTNPHNGADWVFRRDLQTGTTVLASPAVDGPAVGAINSNGQHLAISADGRYIAFDADGDDLVGTGDLNSTHDVFLRDVTAGTTTLVSGTDATHTGNDESSIPRISADGRYVMFYSEATDLLPGDGNNHPDLIRWDRVTNAKVPVNVAAGTTTPSSGGTHVTFSGSGITGGALSADGSRAAFSTDDTNLVPGYSGSHDQAYLRDFTNGTTQLVSSAATATTGANGDSLRVWMSASGNRITWTSAATDLITGFGNLNGSQDDMFTRSETPAPPAPEVTPTTDPGPGGSGTPPADSGTPPAADPGTPGNPLVPETTGTPRPRPHGVTRRGTPKRDVLVGTRYADRLYGLGGDDAITGKPGRDRLAGGPGDDRINAVDGVRDVVDCGAGRHDRATVDRSDKVSGCERVTVK